MNQRQASLSKSKSWVCGCWWDTRGSPGMGDFPPGMAGAAEEPSQHCHSLSGAPAQKQTMAHPCKYSQQETQQRVNWNTSEHHWLGQIVLFAFPSTKLPLWDTNAGVWKPPTPLLQLAWLLLADNPARGTEISQLHRILLFVAFSQSFSARLSGSLHAGVYN